MEARRPPGGLPLPPRSAPLMELHGSGRSGRMLPRRRPLADVTNAAAAAAAAAHHPSSSVKYGAKPKPTHDEISIAYETSSIGSCSSDNPSSRQAGRSASTSRVEMDSAYTHQRAKMQKTKCKGATGVLQSSLSVGRIKSFGDKQKIHEGAEHHGSCSVSYPKPKKKWQYLLFEDINQDQLLLPEEFIEEQQAYFAEIDAFELLEEEVSESELD